MGAGPDPRHSCHFRHLSVDPLQCRGLDEPVRHIGLVGDHHDVVAGRPQAAHRRRRIGVEVQCLQGANGVAPPVTLVGHGEHPVAVEEHDPAT